MKKIALLIFSTTLLNGIAQEEDITEKLRKHSIGVEFGTYVGAILGNNVRTHKTSIQYKHTLKNPAWSFRGSVNYSEHYSWSWTTGDVVALSDSTMTFENNDFGTLNLSSTAGVQRRFGKSKLTWFIGGEAILGFYRSLRTDRFNDQQYTIDTTNNSVDLSTGFQFQETSYRQTERTYLSTGLGLILGAEWKLAKRFSFGVQSNINFLYNIGLKYKYTTIDWSENESISNSSESELNSTFFSINSSPVLLYFNFHF